MAEPSVQSSESNTEQSSQGPVSNAEKIQLAAYEGHDADIPSNEGFIKTPRLEAHAVKLSEAPPRENEEGHHHDEHGSTTDLEKGALADTKETANDPNIVWWDGPDDPENPLNFSPWLRRVNMGLVSGICFVTPLASSMFAPGVPGLMYDFNSDNTELAGFVVSVYVLGFAFGPLFLAPLSELYGRLPIYHTCNCLFLIFTIACGVAKNLPSMIIFRFLEGVWGSAPLTIGGGTVADLFIQEKRGTAMSLFAMGPIIGPIVGPVAGGFLSQAKGWRWIYWLLSMVSGFFTVLSFFFLRETYAVTILQRKTKRLRKETGNMNLRSKLDTGMTSKEIFMLAIVRPSRMLVFSPIVLVTSIYVGIVYGYLYLLFTTFTTVFEHTYGFSSGTVGLSYLGLGGGSLTGLVFFAWLSDKLLASSTAKGDAKAIAEGLPPPGMKAEYRLPPMVLGSILMPVGLFLYGWTAHYRVHWIVPILSTSLIGAGNMAVFMCVSTYLVDAYTVYAASALAANTVIRSIMGATLPLAGQQMYTTLGLGWGNSLLAFIGTAMIPVTMGLVKWGEAIRLKFEVKNL